MKYDLFVVFSYLYNGWTQHKTVER